MRLRVLGSAAGGGFPQWNCGCPNCRAARAGSPHHKPRSQDSLAVSSDGQSWLICNASPDIRQHIESFPALHPRGPRHSPIAGLLLTNGDLDHCLGLFSLRESQPLEVYATASVRRGLVERNAIARTLARFPGHLTWRTLELSRALEIGGGLEVVARPAPGKLPIHLEGLCAPSPEDNVGLWLRDRARGRVAVYLPGVAALEPPLVDALGEADCVFLDGTFFTGDELVRLGLGDRSAQDMAHLPVGGPSGSLERLRDLPARRRIFTHINNTNPLCDQSSPEHRAAVAAGWEVAFDGLEVEV
ncbi:MAG TPA: pyrroloquinoline quinone biosynthesis protein PqqB [Polyangia bacterium]|nr:pyrroloquinoline quinone biosynthesis protein PqqB [Polyangia bacterium]